MKATPRPRPQDAQTTPFLRRGLVGCKFAGVSFRWNARVWSVLVVHGCLRVSNRSSATGAPRRKSPKTVSGCL
eukprot:4615164-Lingulodinium_polyedra.AAC.1